MRSLFYLGCFNYTLEIKGKNIMGKNQSKQRIILIERIYFLFLARNLLWFYEMCPHSSVRITRELRCLCGQSKNYSSMPSGRSYFCWMIKFFIEFIIMLLQWRNVLKIPLSLSSKAGKTGRDNTITFNLEQLTDMPVVITFTLWKEGLQFSLQAIEKEVGTKEDFVQ